MPEFAWPWVIVLLPLPWLLRRWLRPAAPGQALHLPQPGVRLATVAGNRTRGTTSWLLALAWLCLLAAAARPQWVGRRRRSSAAGAR